MPPTASTPSSTQPFGNGAVFVDRLRDELAVVRLHRPEKRNAMNADLLGGLFDALATLREDRACRVIVVTGDGPGFCAGLDLAEGVEMEGNKGLGPAKAGMRVQQYIA